MKIRDDSRKGITPARAGMALLTAALAGAGMGGSGAGAALTGQCGMIASIAAPASVVPGSLQDDTKLLMVTEARQRALTSPLAVDFTLPGLYNTDTQLPLPAARPTIAANTIVSSFLIHADPVGQPSPGKRLTATLNFTSDILGVIVQEPTLFDADSAVGAPGVVYPASATNDRGLELSPNPNVVVDWVRISARSIQMSALTNTVVDEIRVITKGDGDATAPATGYQMVASDGGVFSYGNSAFHGSTADKVLKAPIVAAASPRHYDDVRSQPCTDGGYWLASADGNVYAFDAPVLGTMAGTDLKKPIVGIASTPSGNGYWLVASDGGIFSFGDAAFYGSTGAITLNKPIVGMASTPSGNGYWLVASDGGIFSYGDAAFYGSTGAVTLNKPIVSMASTSSGKGYWLVASDGGIFSYGDAAFKGSTGAITLNQPIVDMVVSPSGAGYWLVATDGGIFSYGDAVFYGSTGGTKLNKPILAAL